jgi:hypothetical protein
MNSVSATSSAIRHAGPPLGIVAIIFTLLKLISLYPVTAITAGGSGFPSPLDPTSTVVAYYQSHPSAVLTLAFFQFGSAIAIGVFTAVVVSRLRFLGIRAAGAEIALFGGFGVAFDSAAGAFILWVLAQAGIAQDATLTTALHLLSFAFGGPGYAVPMGLLMAGVSVTAGFGKLLPKWVVWLGLLLAVIGELSWLSLIALPQLLLLIPLTRFPGFLWLIAAGFLLPNRMPPARGEAMNDFRASEPVA